MPADQPHTRAFDRSLFIAALHGYFFPKNKIKSWPAANGFAAYTVTLHWQFVTLMKYNATQPEHFLNRNLRRLI
jgi:hypothetical protein